MHDGSKDPTKSKPRQSKAKQSKAEQSKAEQLQLVPGFERFSSRQAARQAVVKRTSFQSSAALAAFSREKYTKRSNLL